MAGFLEIDPDVSPAPTPGGGRVDTSAAQAIIDSLSDDDLKAAYQAFQVFRSHPHLVQAIKAVQQLAETDPQAAADVIAGAAVRLGASQKNAQQKGNDILRSIGWLPLVEGPS